MLTAAITHPFYFTFGSDAERVAEPIGLHDALSSDGLTRSCESAYRLFYHCLPLYDQIVVTHQLGFYPGERMVRHVDMPPTTEPVPGIVLLKRLVERGIAAYDEHVDEWNVARAHWGTAEDRAAIRREFLTPELVHWAITTYPFDEKDLYALQRWIRWQSDDTLREVASKVAASLRGDRQPLSRGEGEAEAAVARVIDELVAFTGYAAETGRDVYAFKYYMPLLVARAIQDRTYSTGLRSFSLVLPVIDSPDSYFRARESFAGLRAGIERYQAALVGGSDEDVRKAYVDLDQARQAGLKREFDNSEARQIVSVTCLVTTVGGKWQRYFLPDDRFRLSLAMQHPEHLSGDQARAFQVMLDAVLLAVRDLGADSSVHRTLLASCACQPLLDFVLMSQSSRLGIPEPAKGFMTLGARWKEIQKKVVAGLGNVGRPLAHLGEVVIERRNGLAHPAERPLRNVEQTRGDMLADLCRFVDFIRFLDCSMPLGA